MGAQHAQIILHGNINQKYNNSLKEKNKIKFTAKDQRWRPTFENLFIFFLPFFQFETKNFFFFAVETSNGPPNSKPPWSSVWVTIWLLCGGINLAMWKRRANWIHPALHTSARPTHTHRKQPPPAAPTNVQEGPTAEKMGEAKKQNKRNTNIFHLFTFFHSQQNIHNCNAIIYRTFYIIPTPQLFRFVIFLFFFFPFGQRILDVKHKK